MPPPNFGISLAKALRRKGFKKKSLFRTSRPFDVAQDMLCVLARDKSESEKSPVLDKMALLTSARQNVSAEKSYPLCPLCAPWRNKIPLALVPGEQDNPNTAH
jgi:hypothetical protein